MTSSTEQTETIEPTTAMDTSTEIPQPAAPVENKEEKVVNGVEKESNGTAAAVAESVSDTVEPSTNTETSKSTKRKRSVKKAEENDENNTSISQSRPRRTLTKREEIPVTPSNGTSKVNKTKAARTSVEQTNGDDDDDQDRDKSIPVTYDVADVVWSKMGGHPWWPSLIIRDPNDSAHNFTKVTGNSRAKRMYFVVFFGSTADFAWVSDAAMIPYQGVEAFTKYAQEMVDKAVTKSQKEQLTERFQLKVTIGRREDWETAVKEADHALKLTNDGRLQEIEPKIEFYTKKIATPKSGPGRRPKTSISKPEENSASATGSEVSTLNAADRSLLAEKTFEFKSDDENDSSLDTPLRKTITIKSKANSDKANGSDSVKRRAIPRETPTEEPTTVFGQTANGSSVSYQSRTTNNNETPTKPTGKKRGRPSTKVTSVSSSSDDSPAPAPADFNSSSPSVTTKFTTQRKPIVKPQAFANDKKESRSGFLSATEEQEVIDALEQMKSNKTFEAAEQEAKRRFEHILCLNLNRTHVDVPPEWFYTFLFSHPSLIMKNPQWFNEKSDVLTLTENDLQTSNHLAVLKHQLVVLSKMYRDELTIRPSEPVKKRRSTPAKSNKHETVNNDSHGEEMN